MIRYNTYKYIKFVTTDDSSAVDSVDIINISSALSLIMQTVYPLRLKNSKDTLHLVLI